MAQDIPLVYLVDEGGLRSSIDHFTPIRKDSAHDVFNAYGIYLFYGFILCCLILSVGRPPTRYNISIKFHLIFVSSHSRHNLRSAFHSYPYDEAVQAVQKSNYTRQLDGSEVIDVNQVRIISHNDGAIR